MRRNLPHGTRDDTLIQICTRPLMPTLPNRIPIFALIVLLRPTQDYLTTLMPLPIASCSKRGVLAFDGNNHCLLQKAAGAGVLWWAWNRNVESSCCHLGRWKWQIILHLCSRPLAATPWLFFQNGGHYSFTSRHKNACSAGYVCSKPSNKWHSWVFNNLSLQLLLMQCKKRDL